ncbi:MAG: N-acetyltransferase [Clostridia bacterium]|nr:N-acetyltransferase [Clostridia bacterium]
MHIRKAQPGDIPEIMRIYDSARKSMRAGGNMNQWINGYPEEELIREDIARGVSYVCCEDEELYCVFAFILGDDPTYERIDDGAWPDREPYGTIHRIGSDGRKSGLFPLCYDYCRGIIKKVRIDTHADNAPMHHILKKHGFRRCGIIYVSDGSPRVAYCN